MKDPLDVSPGKGNQGTTRGKEKILLTSVGIEPTTSGLDLLLRFCCCFFFQSTYIHGNLLGETGPVCRQIKLKGQM